MRYTGSSMFLALALLGPSFAAAQAGCGTNSYTYQVNCGCSTVTITQPYGSPWFRWTETDQWCCGTRFVSWSGPNGSCNGAQLRDPAIQKNLELVASNHELLIADCQGAYLPRQTPLPETAEQPLILRRRLPLL